LSISFENEDEFNLKITDQSAKRFTLPDEYPFPFTKNYSDISNPLLNPNYLIDIIKESNFSIRIRRKITNETIFDTSNIEFLFTDRFIEFGTRLPSDFLLGLGERKGEFLYKPGIYTIWNRKSINELDTGTPGHQSSGTHPAYLTREKSGLFHVIFLKNVNGMQFEFNEKKELKFKLLGGIIDLKLFLGDKNPETAIKKFHAYINGFYMMPFWAFGLHQAIIGSFESNKISKILEKFEKNTLQIDAIWSDIELMQKCNKTNNESVFENIKEWKKKVKFVNQISPGIIISANNEFFQKALQEDILIKSAKTKKPLIACQCGDKIVFPDFNHPNITNYWFELLEKYYEKTSFNGISLTLNEPTFSKDFTGELKNLEENCPSSSKAENSINFFKNFTGWIDSSLEQMDMSLLPFLPQKNLEKETLSMDSYHYPINKWFSLSELRELDFHNLNGFLSAYYTSKALNSHLNLTSSFLSTKSGIFGTGNFATHWTGESSFSWSFLKVSIASIFNANLFNLPISGNDICSFSDHPNSELCARWIQLGSLYPLARLKISDNLLDLGLFTFNETFVLEAAKSSLKLRYSLLKYYFGLFDRKNGLGMVFQPLLFQFPDEETLYNIETQFLIGNDLMATPALEQNLELVSVYFPKNIIWVNFITGQVFVNKQGFKQDVDAKINESCPVFVREGRVIFYQNVEKINSTRDLDNKFRLFAVMKKLSNNEYISEGEILAVKDYNDEKKLEICRKGQENLCFVKINIKSNIMGPPEYMIQTTVEFIAKENSLIEDIYFEGLEIYGIKIMNNYERKTIEFEEKLKLEGNSQKTFVHS